MANRGPQKNNTTGYKGVSKKRSKFLANIGKPVQYLGSFATAEEAARAYNEAALEMYGEFARFNVVGTASA